MGTPTLLEIFKIFIKLGSFGFGGPIVLISLMEKECSEKRGWITPTEFNQGYVFMKLLPGPVAYQMALWLGNRFCGKRGALVAGLSLLFPGAMLILALSVFYQNFSHLSYFSKVMEGMRAASLVLIADSVRRLALPYTKEISSWIIAFIAAAFMAVLPRFEPVIIVAGGLALVLAFRAQTKHLSLAPLWPLFLVHFKAGFFVFGTGLAVLPFLQHQAVEVYQWISQPEFLDGVAFGQITPGPITITSIFIGYKAQSYLGALSAFVGMYLPGIILVLGVLPLIERKWGKSAWLWQFQKGAVPAVLGCLVVSALMMGKDTVVGWQSAFVFVLCIVLLWKTKLPGWTVIPVGGLLRVIL
jgi:chromate transporter